MVTRFGLLAAIAACMALAACRPDGRGITDSGWNDDGGADTGSDGNGFHDTGVDPNCASGAEWVYLVDAGYNLIRFEPDELRLTSIGHLDCPGAGAGTPFSMSVDRNGVAWVLYNGGRIYHVSTTDATCAATTFTPHQNGFELFGMGFVSLEEGSTQETLYIAGGAALEVATGSSTLGTIDARLTVSPIAELPGWPELTGTGEGQLWGFFPDSTPPSVRRIDTSNGASLEVHELTALGTFTAAAWAFAAWGGRYYIFLQRQSDDSTHVWRLDPRDDTLEDVLPDIGYRIVGAGVSTCAPYNLI
jgi:hypothetical protein